MKKIKKIVWIPTLVVLVLAAVILTLSLVKVNPLLNSFEGYERVELLRSIDGSEFAHITDENGKDVTKETLEAGVESTSFSVMQAILEGKFSYKPVLKNQQISTGGIKAYSALEGEYILKFYYDEARTVTVDGKEIKFDRLLVRVSESKGEIEEMECVPYLDYNVNNESDMDEYDENGHIGSLYYTTEIITVKMNTSRLMMDVKELLDLYN